jgi:hypothetical protein
MSCFVRNKNAKMELSNKHQNPKGEVMKKIITIGIDLAKNVFAVHAVDAQGQIVWTKPAVKRTGLVELIATIPPCTIGMESLYRRPSLGT